MLRTLEHKRCSNLFGQQLEKADSSSSPGAGRRRQRALAGCTRSHACKFHAGRLDGSLGKWQQLAERGSQQARRDAWADMKRIQAHARAEIRQAEAMQEHAGYSDHDPAQRAIALFRRLYDEMSARTEGVEIAIHNEAQLKTMEVSQLSINESRSAIAGKLTCLVKPCCRSYLANHFFKSPSWPLHSYQSVLLHPCMA